MAIVFAALLFALPTSVFVCVAQGLDFLQGSSVVLLALVSVPAMVTSGVLLAQSVGAMRRHGPFVRDRLVSQRVSGRAGS